MPSEFAQPLSAVIAEDDPVSRLLLDHTAKQRGFITRSFGDGLSALASLTEQPADLLVLDWHLPGMNGPEITRRIRATPSGRHSFVLMATSRSSSDDLQLALRYGIDDYMVKPFGPSDIDFRLRIAQERIRRDHALRDAVLRLKEAERISALATLAEGVAHDFSNILGPIIAYAQLVQRSLTETDKNHSRLDAILRSCARAKTLVGQILIYCRADRGERQPLDVAALVVGMGTELQKLVDPKVTLLLPETHEPKILHGDAAQIQEVVRQLCSNALDAMPEGGTLAVSLDKERREDPFIVNGFECAAGQYAVITVSDTGTGIPPEALPHLFDPFFSTKERTKGTGMGLAVVAGVARHHRGAVRVTTQLGHGSKFEFLLPMAASGV